MKAMFVNEDEWIYAKAIVYGYKTIETRSRDMLGKLVGERVAVIRTRHGKKPMVIGYVTIGYRYYEDNLDDLDRLRIDTLIQPGGKYDGKPRWLYSLYKAEALPRNEWYPLPENAVRHGRSWAEW